MCARTIKISLSVCVLLISFDIAAGKTDLKELERRCADAREAKIAPLRKVEIEKCATKDRNTRDAREKCERHYVDYGEGARYKSGGHRERMFNDLPECLKFYDAEKASKKNSKR